MLKLTCEGALAVQTEQSPTLEATPNVTLLSFNL